MVMDYLRFLEQGYAATASEEPRSRLEYLSDFIFEFITYDSEAAELFAEKALEVCAAISDSKTLDYISDAEQYRWYLLMVNMPFFAGRLDWGSSIRGAWWDYEVTELASCGLWDDGKQLVEPMQLTHTQWREFIAALRQFGKPNVNSTAHHAA